MEGGAEKKKPAGAWRRLPKLKTPAGVWRNYRDHRREEQQEVQQEQQLDEVSRQLIMREEELFSQVAPSEEEEDRLQRDLEDLKLQIWTAVHNTFPSSSSSSAAGRCEELRSAVAAILQQEAQDQRWTDSPQDRVPVWRPEMCLSTHNSLLHSMVESRLTAAVSEDGVAGADKLSSAVKKQVCRVGGRVKGDLLAVVRTVKDCYPPHMDILNVYARLYHQSFSAQLTELAASRLEVEDCSYLLFWVNQYYPEDVLKHEELDGQIQTDCLGSLLLQEDLDQLEERVLTHKQDKVKLWLHTALQKEEEGWLSGQTPELTDGYRFSPLAVDVIQVIDSSLAEFRCAVKDQSKAQRLAGLLEAFLCSYEKSLKAFLKGSHDNARSVIKAQLVCEQQLRDYITAQAGSLSDEQRRRCLHTLSALRDCGYRSFTGPLHAHVKAGLSALGTVGWVDGSVPVVDSLLDSLSQQLSDLVDLKPACRQSLLSLLHQDVVLQYVKKMMKTRIRSREQQAGGAQQMTKDTRQLDSFFTEESKPSWLSLMLYSLAEILRLQDPASIQLELVSLARTFPDLSDDHVSALLSMKPSLSATDVSSIRRSVKENRLHEASTNHSPPFFSNLKVKWINNKINQMRLKI